MHSHVDFASSWEAVTCWLPKPVLKRCPWINVLTKIFTVCNFGNTSAMTIIFCLKMFKISCRIKKWNKKLRKSFGLEIIAFEFGVGNFHNLEQDTRIRKSVCKQIPLRFHLTLGETFSKSTSLKMIRKLHKSSVLEISQAVGTLSHVDCQSHFWNGTLYRVFQHRYSHSVVSKIH